MSLLLVFSGTMSQLKSSSEGHAYLMNSKKGDSTGKTNIRLWSVF